MPRQNRSTRLIVRVASAEALDQVDCEGDQRVLGSSYTSKYESSHLPRVRFVGESVPCASQSEVAECDALGRLGCVDQAGDCWQGQRDKVGQRFGLHARTQEVDGEGPVPSRAQGACVLPPVVRVAAKAWERRE